MTRVLRSRLIAAFSLSLYIASMFLPAFECATQGDKSFLGYVVLLIGYMGLLAFDPRWFANPIYFIMICHLFFGKAKSNSAMPVLASLLAICSIFFEAAGCEGGGGAPGIARGLAIGGYVWVIAVLSASVTYAFAAEPAAKETDSRG